MAPRSFWKGYLKLSLVTCPVAMLPATSEAEKVHFHTLNRATGNRVQSRYVDAETGRPVDDEGEVKGYERGEGEYVTLENEELDAVALESTRTIDIEKFVPAESVEWIWYDTPHFLVPDDKVGEEAFSVIRDAMHASDMRAITRVVLYHRERAVLLDPRDKGIVLWTLRYGDEGRDPKTYFAGIKKAGNNAKLKQSAQHFVKAHTKDWSTSMIKDPVQDVLLDLIASKEKANRSRAKPAKRKRGNVIDLMAVLKKSLEHA
jgi:DNA end-binding protein Ku